MDNLLENDTLYEELGPTVEALGFSVVHLSHTPVRGTYHVQLVVFRPAGVSVDNCAEIHRTLLPRLEISLGSPEIHLEVSSPGVYRKIKSTHEFEVFRGSTVEVLTEESQEWMRGRLYESLPSSVVLETPDGRRKIDHRNIRKARLDYP